MSHIRKGVAIALTVMAVIFMLQNLAIVEVNFLSWSVRLPRAILLLVVFLLGSITSLLLLEFRRGEHKGE